MYLFDNQVFIMFMLLLGAIGLNCFVNNKATLRWSPGVFLVSP